MKVIPTIGYTFHGRSGRMEGMTVKETGVLESWSDGGTPDHAPRRMPTARINCVAAAGLRHSLAPEKCLGRYGKHPYQATERVVRCGKRRYASCAFTALSGCRMRKFTDFYRITPRRYHLGPDKSTQVVDFPHLRVVRLFWGKPGIWKTKDVNAVKPGTEGSLRAERKGETHHIYASRYIDFYACNSP